MDTLSLLGFLIVPTITPRLGSSVDLPSLERLMDFLIEGGVDAVFILGTTGEFQYLGIQEKKGVIWASSESIRNRVPLLVGVSARTMDETRALAGTSEKAGAQALVLAPMFGEGEPWGKIGAVVESSALPVLLYNNPEIHGGSMLPLPLVKQYTNHPKVIGIKDSSGDWGYFLELLKLQSEGFHVFQGRESLILRSLEAGAEGIVAGLANAAPALCKEILLRRDQATMDRVLAAKSEIKKLSPDTIPALKKRLVELGVIRSDEMFKPG